MSDIKRGWRLLRSGLTGKVYIVRAWREQPNGVIEVIGEKHDVTEDYLDIRRQEQSRTRRRNVS